MTTLCEYSPKADNITQLTKAYKAHIVANRKVSRIEDDTMTFDHFGQSIIGTYLEQIKYWLAVGVKVGGDSVDCLLIESLLYPIH